MFNTVSTSIVPLCSPLEGRKFLRINYKLFYGRWLVLNGKRLPYVVGVTSTQANRTLVKERREPWEMALLAPLWGPGEDGAGTPGDERGDGGRAGGWGEGASVWPHGTEAALAENWPKGKVNQYSHRPLAATHVFDKLWVRLGSSWG